MSKRKGPFLITDLASKLGAAPNPSRTNRPSTDTDHARNAYGFIAENYKVNPPSTTSAILEPSPTCASAPENKVKPNTGQTGAKVKSKLSQSAAKVEPSEPSSNSQVLNRRTKVEPQLEPRPEPKLSQSAAKVEPSEVFPTLVGLQLETLRYVFESCRFRGSKVSGPIVIQNLAESLNSTPAAVRKAIQRLEQKTCLMRATYKDGRGGWTEYQLPDEVYSALLLNESRAKLKPNLGQSRAKLEPELEPQLRPKVSSSSSILELENLKTTTSDQVLQSDKFELGPPWLSVDFSSLMEIGFTETHLTQVGSRGKLTPELLQSSIDAFAFDLKKNQKAKSISGSPLNFFMGIVGKGSVYAPPANYETPEDEALRKLVEAKAEQAAKRSALLQQLKDIEFDEWYQNLSEPEKLERSPLFQKEGEARRAAIRSQWEAQVWPEQSQSLPGMVQASRDEIGKLIDQSLGDASG